MLRSVPSAPQRLCESLAYRRKKQKPRPHGRPYACRKTPGDVIRCERDVPFLRRTPGSSAASIVEWPSNVLSLRRLVERGPPVCRQRSARATSACFAWHAAFATMATPRTSCRKRRACVRRLSTFRGEAARLTWLTRIVLNEANGRLRRCRWVVDAEQIEASQADSARFVSLPATFGNEDPTPQHARTGAHAAGAGHRAVSEAFGSCSSCA